MRLRIELCSPLLRNVCQTPHNMFDPINTRYLDPATGSVAHEQLIWLPRHRRNYLASLQGLNRIASDFECASDNLLQYMYYILSSINRECRYHENDELALPTVPAYVWYRYMYNLCAHSIGLRIELCSPLLRNVCQNPPQHVRPPKHTISRPRDWFSRS